MTPRKRIVLASVAGIAVFIIYVGLATALGDAVVGRHWLLQALYFLIAGTLWVIPIRWLMYWGAGKRP